MAADNLGTSCRPQNSRLIHSVPPRLVLT
jgi:hypothetical protein